MTLNLTEAEARILLAAYHGGRDNSNYKALENDAIRNSLTAKMTVLAQELLRTVK